MYEKSVYYGLVAQKSFNMDRSLEFIIVRIVSGVQFLPNATSGNSNASARLKKATSMRSEDELNISVRNFLLFRFVT